MFTNTKAKYYGDDKVLLDSACLSTDTKPTTGVANGSKLLEMDTSTVYAFDEANGEWLAQSSSGGGGGGGGGAEPLMVNYTWDDNLETFVLDKTAGELKTAFESGTAVFIRSVEISEGWSESTKTVMIDGIEASQQAGETEGEFESFYITFYARILGDMVANSSISIEDALTKYPHSQG